MVGMVNGGSGGVYVFTHYLSWLTCLHGGVGCQERVFDFATLFWLYLMHVCWYFLSLGG